MRTTQSRFIRLLAVPIALVLALPGEAAAAEDQTAAGTHDGYEGSAGPYYCAAAGWAVDPDDPFADLTIRVLSDGQMVAIGVADLFRQDLVDAGVSPDGYSGFHIGLWGLVSLNVAHSITVQAQDHESGEWVDLNLTPKSLTCVSGTATSPNPKTAYFTVDCQNAGTVFAEAVFFASGSNVSGTTSAFRVVGSNDVMIVYTAGTDPQADDVCLFGWTGGAEPPAPWNATFAALVFHSSR